LDCDLLNISNIAQNPIAQYINPLLPESTHYRLRTQLDALAVILAGAPENAMEHKPASGKWSARENLAHLARYQDVFLERTARILADDNPNFAAYKAEHDQEWPDWAALPAGDIFVRLHAGRAQIIAQFEALTDAQLARVGTHARLGR
jgi:hypothetical protein